MRPSGMVVVRCLRCRHEATLSDQALVRFGLKPDAPISTFVKRLRCHECGSGSVWPVTNPGPSVLKAARKNAQPKQRP